MYFYDTFLTSTEWVVGKDQGRKNSTRSDSQTFWRMNKKPKETSKPTSIPYIRFRQLSPETVYQD